MRDMFRPKQTMRKNRKTFGDARYSASYFEALEPRQMMSATSNTLSTALTVSNITGSSAVYTGTVSASDARDYYKFTLSSSQVVSLALSGLSSNADLRLLNSSGQTISISAASGRSDESISTQLSAGTYYVYVYRNSSSSTSYSLSLNGTTPITDNAGNTRQSATDLGTLTTTTQSDYVGITDTNDYYKFTVSGLSSLSLTLTGLSADADVQVLNSSGRVVAISQKSGSSDESISTMLTSGTYYIRVYRYSGNTNYTLNATATTITDLAGNTRSSAYSLGTLTSTETTITDFIGSYDTNDYYSFTVSSQSTLSLSVTGLSANATLYLLDSTGSVVATSANYGTSDETIASTLEAGTYYIRVTCAFGNTTYTLKASATATTPADDTTDDTDDTTDTTDTTTNTNTATGTTAVTNLVSLSELQVTGSSDADIITVTQANGVLTLTINGNITTYTVSTLGEIAIWGGDGNDSITIDSSVSLNSRIYGGTGSDTLVDLGSGRNYIVAIGGGVDTLTGNGSTTQFWFDSTDSTNATTADTSAGRVHKVTSFYQPFTTNTSSANYVSLELSGQNLTDPTDSGTTIRLTNRSFWGTDPSSDDINQGYLGDCYYLATIAAMADTSESKLLTLAVDLGDGTYAVMFTRNGVTSYVRVDGDLAAYNGTTEYNSTGSSGAIWACIFEKAYAYYRTGADTYSSLEGGLMSAVFRDFGITSTTVNPATQSTTSLYASISAALAAGKAVTLGTLSSVSSSIPLIGNHAYTVISASKDSSGNITYVVRNPWGYDGASNSSDLSDGLITITAAQLKAACDLATWMA